MTLRKGPTLTHMDNRAVSTSLQVSALLRDLIYGTCVITVNYLMPGYRGPLPQAALARE